MTLISSIVRLTKRPPAAPPPSFTVYRGNGGSRSVKKGTKKEKTYHFPHQKEEWGENSPLNHVTSVGRSFPFLMIWAGKRCVVDRPPLKSCPKKGGKEVVVGYLLYFLGRAFLEFCGKSFGRGQMERKQKSHLCQWPMISQIKIRK